jgi:DNA modification methylase
VILDPFMGSGTTAVLGARNCRFVLGIDEDGDYLRGAAARITANLKHAQIENFRMRRP